MTKRVDNAATVLQKALRHAKPWKEGIGISTKLGTRQLGKGQPVQLELVGSTVHISQGVHVTSLGKLAELKQNPTILKAKLGELKSNPLGTELDGINEALSKGGRLHGFSSGGGLRVISIKIDGNEVGYGEHPHVENALTHASEDYLVGGRPYNEVYGGKYPHYLTGDTRTSSPLDSWLRFGSTFDAWQENGNITVQLNGYAKTHTPKEVNEQAKTTGKPVTWEDRGFQYETTFKKGFFANGEDAHSTSVIKIPLGQKEYRAWMYHITKTGQGTTFEEAVNSAFNAKEVEVSDPH